MSTALAIAGVSAVLQSMLTGLKSDLSTALGVAPDITALAPEDVTQTKDAKPCLNLFLYQVTPNPGWRNVNHPSRDAAGDRIANPPLALDLHYLLTAYGSADLQAEVLLGYGMQLLHETPVLARDLIRSILNPAIPPVLPIYQALQTVGLADQIEQIKVTLAAMNTEELSKLWTALQAQYRPTATYIATVVLIEASRAARSPLPVLSRGKVDPVTHREAGVAVQPNLLPPYPFIESIAPDTKQIAAELGDTLIVSGHNLDGVAGQYRLLIANAWRGIERDIFPEVAASGTESSVSFLLPNDPVNIPAGTYTACLQLQKAGEPRPRRTNVLPLTIAPKIQSGSLPASINIGGNPSITLTPTCTPQVRPNQRVSLLLGGIELLADPFTVATATPSFTFTDPVPEKYWVRLRVDGVDSLLVDTSVSPPKFTGPQIDVQP
jgi:uncharacterized protein DUF4255